MTADQFNETIRRIPKVREDSKATQAARMVLVSGYNAKYAAEQHECSKPNVHQAINRIAEAYTRLFKEVEG